MEDERHQDKHCDDHVVEETWTSSEGVNVFDVVALECQYRTVLIPLLNIDDTEQGSQNLQIRSMTRQDMTPLDMNFKKGRPDDEDEQELPADDEFYDGTGHLVWLASIAFVYLLSMKDSMLLSYFKDKRVCELGCGTGTAGVAALKLGLPSCYLFTDNDEDTLRLCRINCELNMGDDWKEKQRYDGEQNKCKYAFQLFSWGDKSQMPSSQSKTTTNAMEETPANTSDSFDTVLATDCVYDIKMIPPLIQSAVSLLSDGGAFILSHVPRFCLPRRDDLESNYDKVNETGISSGDLHLNLEYHIVQQVEKSGFRLSETIRPFQVLNGVAESQSKPTNHEPRNVNSANEEILSVSVDELRDAHAVLFVFKI